jgi:large subunit ribosomal protein L29
MANKEEVAELRELDVPALIAALAEAKDDSFKLRFQNATGQLEKTTSLGEARKRIARISMLLREREIAAAEAGGVSAPARTALVAAKPATATKATARKATAKKAVATKAAAKPASAQKKAN